jgi:hypothetical protein
VCSYTLVALTATRYLQENRDIQKAREFIRMFREDTEMLSTLFLSAGDDQFLPVEQEVLTRCSHDLSGALKKVQQAYPGAH